MEEKTRFSVLCSQWVVIYREERKNTKDYIKKSSTFKNIPKDEKKKKPKGILKEV